MEPRKNLFQFNTKKELLGLLKLKGKTYLVSGCIAVKVSKTDIKKSLEFFNNSEIRGTFKVYMCADCTNFYDIEIYQS